jgi:hypothetical protein
MPVLVIFVSIFGTLSLARFVLRIRTEHAATPKAVDEHFIGGGTWYRNAETRSRASWPLVRLDVLPSGIVVGPTSRWLRWAVPQVIMQWADIASVERRPTGVRFNLKSANRPALLFQMHRDALLAALRPYPIELRA